MIQVIFGKEQRFAETSDRFDNFKDDFRKMFAIETLSNNQLAGFIEEGRRRGIIYMDGKFYDNILLGVTREEFDEIEKQYSNNKNQ